MSEIYCPECGAQSEATAIACRECRFPLELRVTLDGQGVHISGQAERWKRIAQLLKRGGVRIQTSDHVQNRVVWWSLPILGAFILLLSLVFGGSIAGAIWAPPPPARTVLDLNDPNPSKPEEKVDEDPTLAFMSEVLKPNAEQERAANQEVDLSEFVDKPVLSTAEIEERAKQVLVVMTVANRKARGTIVNEQGDVLVAQKNLQGAFVRNIRSFMEKGKIVEREVITMPELRTIDGKTSTGDKVIEDELLGVTLLQSQFKQRLNFEPNFNAAVGSGERLWIAREVDGHIALEESETVTQVPFSDEVYFWVLTSKYSASHTGSPVFNTYGDLVGILMDHNDESAVATLLTLRERAPQIYKSIH